MAKDDEDLERTHIWLFKDDVAWVHQMFDANLGYSAAIRMMVRKFRRHIEAKAAEQAAPLSIDPADLQAGD